MTDIHQLIESGSAHVWLYIPVAILLGSLHGLEPGHSKTMMAAFIIAIRGTIWQAVLLGLSAAISHSLIIWVLAALALNYGSSWNAESTEPYFHLASAVMILGLAAWMFFRTRREVAEAAAHQHGHGHSHDHGHDHDHGYHQDHDHHHHEAPSPAPTVTASRNAAGEIVTASGLILPAGSEAAASSLILPDNLKASEPKQPEGVLLDTGHGWLTVCIYEDGVPPRFRIYPCKADGKLLPMPRSTTMGIETTRLDGSVQKFQFEAKPDCWESTATVPEPHEFAAVLTMGHGDHAHTYRLRFHEHDDHHHAAAEVEAPEDGYQDAHERAHAEDIARRFANRSVTTPQIIMFGITGGLMPCPAAFTILLVCLQVKRVTLGFSLVAAFSFGLALTMVVTGVVAAWSVQRAQKRFSGFGDWMRRAPYISCVLLVLLAAFMAWQGWQGLQHAGHAH